jgi:Fe2+ transport system protein FeoA
MTLKQFNHKCCCFAGKMKQQWGKGKCGTAQVMPLSRIRHHGRKRICKITGDRKLCARMASMGFFPGEEVEILCSENDSQCILKIQGGTVSLDNTASRNILVQSIE